MRIRRVFWLIFLCISNAFAATCPSGFVDVSSDYPTTFSGKYGDSCPSGYEAYTAPSTLSFKFGGLLLDSGPDLCGSDSHYVNGECVTYAQENCPSGFYKNSANDSTFSSKKGNLCLSGYENYTHEDNLRFVFNGMILDNAKTVCSSGHYVEGTCTTYSTTGCITGYVDAGTDNVVASVGANGSCPTGYDALWAYQSCTADTTENVCTTLCDGDMIHTGAGYCAAACGNGLSVLHVGNSLTFPLYGTRTTTPSIVFANENGQCYVNLVPGRASGAVNVNHNNTIYHTTD